MQVDGNQYCQYQTPSLRLKAQQTSCRFKFLNPATPRNTVNLQSLLQNRKSRDPGRPPEILRRAQNSQTVQKTPLKSKTHPPQFNCPPAPQRSDLIHAHPRLTGSSHDQLRRLEGLNPSLCPGRSCRGVLGVCALMNRKAFNVADVFP